MHYAKAPAIDTTFRVSGGVTFASIRQRKRQRRMKAIERYVNKQTASTPTDPQPKPSVWQRVKNLFS